MDEDKQDKDIVVDFGVFSQREQQRQIQAQRDDITDVAVHLRARIRDPPVLKEGELTVLMLLILFFSSISPLWGSLMGSPMSDWRMKRLPRVARHRTRSKEATLVRLMTPVM